MDLAPIYKTYFDCAFCFLLSPYRVLVKDKAVTEPNTSIINTNGRPHHEFKLRSFFPQKCFCFLVTCSILIRLVLNIREQIPYNLKDPRNYFNFLSELFVLSWFGLYLKLVWLRSEAWLRIVVSLDKKDPCAWPTGLSSSCRRTCLKFLIAPFFLLAFLMIVGSANGYNGFKIVLDLPQFWKDAKVAACNKFQVEGCSQDCSGDGVQCACLTLIHLVSYYFAYFLMVFNITLMPISSLVLWLSVNSFVGELEFEEAEVREDAPEKIFELCRRELSRANYDQTSNKTAGNKCILPEKVMERLDELIGLASLINSVIGNILTCYILNSVIYYAVSFDRIFRDVLEEKGDDGIQIGVKLTMKSIFVFEEISFLLLSANVDRQVGIYIIICVSAFIIELI